MHQERQYPSRVHGTALGNPTSCALPRLMAPFGARVAEIGDFAATLDRALAWTKEKSLPALIELLLTLRLLPRRPPYNRCGHATEMQEIVLASVV